MNLFLVLSLLILPLFLGGCTSPRSDCVEIGFPAPGALAVYHTEFMDLSGRVFRETNTTFEALDWDKTIIGDGSVREVLPLAQGSATHYLDRNTGYMVRYDSGNFPVTSFSLSETGTFSGHQFFGRCLSEGASVVPFLTPGHELSVEVLEVSTERVITRVTREAVPPVLYGNESTEATRYLYTWSGSRLFPDRVEVWNPLDDRYVLAASYRLIDQDDVRADIRPVGTLDPPRGMARVERWPDFDVPWAELTYAEFVADVEARSEVQDYLRDHPDAFASLVEYEEVTEPQSRATFWRAILRDASTDALDVSLVRRCFENQTHRVLYGDCQDRWREDYGDYVDAPGHIVRPAPALPELNSSGSSEVLEVAAALRADERPVRIEWRAFPFNDRNREYGFVEGRPGWILSYGTVVGEVSYLPTGPVWFQKDIEVDAAVELHETGWLRSMMEG